MTCFISKSLQNMVSKTILNTENKHILHLFSIIGCIGSVGGLTLITYRLYKSHSITHRDDNIFHPIIASSSSYSYTGIQYCINYLANYYKKSLTYFRLKSLRDVKYEQFKHLIHPELYKDLYFPRMMIMKSAKNDECSKNDTKLHKNILFESTPRGNVIIYFNKDDEQFHYYSDNGLPFHIIDSVLQKYVVTFHCTHLYHTSRFGERVEESNVIENPNGNNASVSINSNSNGNKTKNKYANVYAKLKNYNKTNNGDVNKENTNVSNKTTHKNNKDNNKSNNKSNKKDIDDKTFVMYHKLKHCGKLRDFDFKNFKTNMNKQESKLDENKREINKVKSISYKDFKRD